MHKVVQADDISSEIDRYFEDIKNAFGDCEVCTLSIFTVHWCDIIDIMLHI